MAKKKTRSRATSKATKRSTTRAPRKCSVCRIEGHNKRSCTELLQKKTIPKTKKSTYVFVNAHEEAVKSPHMVDLSKKEHTERWGEVKSYKEALPARAERKVVDLAKLVKQANKTTRSKKQETSIRKTKRPAIRFPSRYIPTVRFQDVSRYLYEKTEAAKIECLDVFAKSVDGLERVVRVRARVYAILALVLLMVLPLPTVGFYRQVKNDTAYIVEQSTNAFMSLQSSTVAALSANIAQAQYDLNDALKAFSDAQNLIDKEYKALTYVARMLPVVGKRVESRQAILVAGHHIALGNTYLVKGVSEATDEQDMTTTDRIGVLKAHIESAIPQYQEALIHVADVSARALSAEYQQSFEDFKLLFASFIDDMQDMTNAMTGLEVVLGTDDFRRYLVMFQNHHEIRPTGGFMGSFALVDVQKGKILNVDVPGGGTYDVQGQLSEYVEPPLPLQLVNNRWEFHDANWFPDFPASAEKIAWFYEHSRGTTVDGVISINATVLERLLKVVGPVYNESFDLLIDADSALAKIQRQVEDVPEDEQTPKQIIASLLDQLLGAVGAVEPKQLIAMVTELHSALQEREIQIHVADGRAQRKFREFGWSGELRAVDEDQDYLMVVNANIGGGKSDARVQQFIDHQAVVEEDGSVINTVIVRREHTGVVSEEYYGHRNVNYMRLYVPHGSELIDAGGFSFPAETSFLVPETWYEMDADLQRHEQDAVVHIGSGTRVSHQFGKTTFGNWVLTQPGEASEVYFVYKTPHVLDMSEESSRYSVLFQKQSGVESVVESTIIYPEDWRPVWRTDDTIDVSANGAVYTANLDTDQSYGIVLRHIE